MAVTHRSKPVTIRSYNPNFNRFLKPGALARLRDSRINKTAAAAKVYANSQICVEFESNGVEQQLQNIDENFVFTMKTFGPRFLNRKKLGARKSSFVAPSIAVAAAADDVVVVSESATLVADVAAH